MARPKLADNAAIKNRRALEALHRESARMTSNDIGEIPAVVDPDRRARCEADPILWLETYLADDFFLAFTEEQREYIRNAWSAIEKKRSSSILAPRGWGKTSIMQALILKAIMQGLHKIVLYIVAEGNKTKEAYEFFQGQLEDNEILAADYPEICYPIKLRDGVAQKPLHYKGKRCGIKMSPEYIKLPTIKGSPSSGALLKYSSVFSSGIRGAKFYIRGEGSFRPSMVAVDDVQSDGTAKSELEVGNIMGIIEKTLALVGGFDRKTGRKVRAAMIIALTQNQPNDVAVRCMNKPEFYTKVYRFFTQLPDDFSEWRKYRSFRAEAMLKSKSADEAEFRINDYYRDHKAAIERDCAVANPEIYTESELTAIQHGLNTWCNSLVSFWCELQNDAERAYTEDGGFLTPTIVLRKVINLPRCVIPDGTVAMTAFIDVGEHYHNWQVTAFGEGLSFIHTVDFGVWPDQKVPMVTKKVYNVDLQDAYHDGELDKPGMIRRSLTACMKRIIETPYFWSNGKDVDVHAPIEFVHHATRQPFRFLAAIGVDAGDGNLESVVWNACSDFHETNMYANRAIPCYGASATARLFRYLPLTPGEWRRGATGKGECDWIENPDTKQRVLAQHTRAVKACVKFDANTYKTWRDNAWLMSQGKIGSHTLFNERPEYLVMYANHQCSEEYVMRKLGEYDYRKYQEKKPKFSDNEFLDTDTGCVMLAGYVGLESESMVVRRNPRRAVVRNPNRTQIHRAGSLQRANQKMEKSQ